MINDHLKSVGTAVITCAILGFLILLEGCSDISRQIEVHVESADALIESSDAESISEDRYAYGLLDEDERSVYDEELEAILEFKEKVIVSTEDPDILSKAYDAIMCDYGGLFWINGYSYSQRSYRGARLVFYPGYTMTKEEAASYQKDVDDAIEVFLSGISITDSDYDKAKYVFEELIRATDYEEGADENQNILSVFLYHRSVCYGYARAAHYLFSQLDIPCIIVLGSLGDTDEVNHAWNLVELDGEYYCMDVTLGEGRDAASSDAGEPDHSYMCATDDYFSKDHTYSGEFALPACTADADAYSTKEKGDSYVQ